jgi:hypothetical protein
MEPIRPPTLAPTSNMLAATNMIITAIPTTVPNGPARLQPHPPPKVPKTTPMYTANGTDAVAPTMEPILAARLKPDQNFIIFLRTFWG